MLMIIGSLLGGWILSLFGFQGVVIAGMAQVFGVTLTSTGYYFLFGLLGALKSIAVASRGGIKLDFNKMKEKAKETK